MTSPPPPPPSPSPASRVCAECGIRYGAQLDACPWCSHTQLPTPPPPTTPPPTTPPPTPPPPTPAPAIATPPPPQPVHPVAPPAAPPAPPPAPTAATAPAPAAATQVRHTAPPRQAAATVATAPPRVAAGPAPPPPGGPTRAAAGWQRRLRRAGVWTVAIVACLVLGALIAEFAPLGFLTDGAGSPASLPSPDPAVVPPVAPEPQDEAAPPPTEGAAPTTFAATPSPETVELAPIVPTGDPIPLEELALGVDGIGELVIGDPALTVLGRLAATLGEPDEDLLTISDGTFSGCPGEEVRVVRWGTLAVSAVGPDSGRVFAGYRVDLRFGADPARPGLATISGLQVGDTVADLQRIYSTLDLQFFDGIDGPVYELRRQSDGALLLTGPLSGTEPGSVVEGIYSPDSCL